MSEARTIKVVPDDAGTFTVQVVDEHDSTRDYWEEVAADDIEGTAKELKWKHFRVQDYLAEITDIEFDSKYLGLGADELEEPLGETYWGSRTHKWYRWTLTFTRNGQSVQLPYGQGNSDLDPDRDRTLELYLDDILTLGNYATSEADTDGLGVWAEELGYGSFKGGIAKAIKAWKETWRARNFFLSILTEEELENIKHAFEEGRRR